MTDLSIKLMEISSEDCEDIIIEKLNQLLDQALTESNKFFWPKLRNIVKDITLNLKERSSTNEKNLEYLNINKKIEKLEEQYNAFFKLLFNEPHKLEEEVLKRQNNKYHNEEDLLKKIRLQNQSISLIYGLDCSDSCSSNILNKNILHKSNKDSETNLSNSLQIYKNLEDDIKTNSRKIDNSGKIVGAQKETKEREFSQLVCESSKSNPNNYKKNDNEIVIETQTTQEKSFGNLELGEFPCTQAQTEFATQSPEFGFISSDCVTNKERPEEKTIDESCSMDTPSMDFIVYPI